MTTWQASHRSGTAPVRQRRALWVLALCWLIVVFDGYDLIVYGTTIPALLEEPGWGLTPGSAGTIGSLAFLGMLVGALSAGNLSDRLGRRGTIIGCVAWFTVFTAACGLAPNAETFGVLRFVAGIGLGGLVPSANALAAEFVTDRYRSVVATAMMSGVPLGGCLAAVVAIPTIPALGWEALYFYSGAGLLLVVALVALLPESPTWLRARSRTSDAEAIETRYSLTPAPEATVATATRPSLGTLLRPPYVLATVLFSTATIATLFAWYGLGTWLPKLTDDVRFDLGSDPLTYLLALNLGAVAGSVVTAYAATRVGPLRSAVASATCAALGLAFLLTYPSSVAAVYAALILAGVGTHGTACLIISAVASHYPPIVRGSALGISLGAGRIGAVVAPSAAGWLLDAGFGVGSNFVLFAAASAIAAVLLGLTYLATRPAGAAVLTTTH